MSRVIFSSIFCALYLVWVVFDGYSWVYFFGFEALMVFGVLKDHYSFKKATKNYKKLKPDAFSNDQYWKVLERYGVYIYRPRGAESIAVTFTINRLLGYLFTIIFLLFGEWIYASICFVNTFLSSMIAAWLDPTFFMKEFAEKKGNLHYQTVSEMIEELKSWVRTAAA